MFITMNTPMDTMMKTLKAFSFFLIFALSMYIPFSANADPLDNWQVRKVFSEDNAPRRHNLW